MAGRSIGRRGPAGGIAEQGRLYWSSRGTSRNKRAPIKWGVPGDFMSCVRHMTGKVRDPRGYCQRRHIEATGEPAGKHAHGGGGGRKGARIRR